MEGRAPPRGARRWAPLLAGLVALAALVAIEGRRGLTGDAPLPAAREAATAPPAEPSRPASSGSALEAATAGVSSPAADRLAALQARLAASSLRGSEPDGELRLDAAGRLVPDAGLRRRFDYWLSLDGEFSDDDVRALLHADIASHHGEGVASQALAAFERYLGLRAQLAAAPPEGSLDARLQALQAARRAWFGADAAAMFGAEEAQVAHTLERRRIEDARLAGDERAARLAALEARRAAAERAAQADATSAHLAAEQTRQLDADGADPATRREQRAALWGPEAADRLAALDAERARWNARLVAFARERDRLLADPRLDAVARERALAALLLRDFDEAERARVEALARTGSLPPGG